MNDGHVLHTYAVETATATVDPNRLHSTDEIKALVTIEVAERLAAHAYTAIRAGRAGYAAELLQELTGVTSARTCAAVKRQALSDTIAARAREEVTAIVDRLAEAALNPVEGHCCQPAADAGDNDIPGIDHDGECRNFDGAPPYYQG